MSDLKAHIPFNVTFHPDGDVAIGCQRGSLDWWGIHASRLAVEHELTTTQVEALRQVVRGATGVDIEVDKKAWQPKWVMSFRGEAAQLVFYNEAAPQFWHDRPGFEMEGCDDRGKVPGQHWAVRDVTCVAFRAIVSKVERYDPEVHKFDLRY